MMDAWHLCNCAGPSPEGHHEPHCWENGLMQSVSEHKHWSWAHQDCGYGSPFFHPTEAAARASYWSHIQGCGAGRA